jgi:hypothetical protein
LTITRLYTRTLIRALGVIIKVKSLKRSLKVNIVNIINRSRIILLIVPFCSLIRLRKAGKIRIRTIRMIRIRTR